MSHATMTIPMFIRSMLANTIVRGQTIATESGDPILRDWWSKDETVDAPAFFRVTDVAWKAILNADAPAVCIPCNDPICFLIFASKSTGDPCDVWVRHGGWESAGNEGWQSSFTRARPSDWKRSRGSDNQRAASDGEDQVPF